jgi:hypothetical protein
LKSIVFCKTYRYSPKPFFAANNYCFAALVYMKSTYQHLTNIDKLFIRPLSEYNANLNTKILCQNQDRLAEIRELAWWSSTKYEKVFQNTISIESSFICDLSACLNFIFQTNFMIFWWIWIDLMTELNLFYDFLWHFMTFYDRFLYFMIFYDFYDKWEACCIQYKMPHISEKVLNFQSSKTIREWKSQNFQKL